MATREQDIPQTTYRSPFARYTIKQVTSGVNDQKADSFDVNEKYVSGNHWQEGNGWIGPPDRESPAYKRAIAKVAGQFTPRDAINEILGRVVDGVAKQEARISTAPLGVFEDEDAQKEAAEKQKAESARLLAAISTWWDKKKFHEKIRRAIRYARWAEKKDTNTAVGYLRFWVPISSTEAPSEEDNAPAGARKVPTGTFEETIQRIHVESPDPRSCAILIDDETQEAASVFLFERDGQQFAELAFVEYNPDGTPGDTIIRIIGGKGGAEAEEYRWALGGRLPLVQMEAPLLVTDPVRRQQNRLNFFETNLLRNVETAGFPERVITNAEPSGILVPMREGSDPGPYPTKIVDGRMYEIHPVPRLLGAGVTTEVQGVRDGDRITTPGVHRFEPVAPDGTIKAARHAYQVLLEEAKQGFVMMAGDATASGVSRETAQGDHLSDLTNTKGPAEGMIRDGLETLVAMASFFSGSGATFLEKMRITADLTLTPATPSPDQQRVAKEHREAGAITTAEYMTRIGVEDPETMQEQLERDPYFIVEQHRKRAEVMDLLQVAGATFLGAALAVGYTEEEAEALQQGREEDEERIRDSGTIPGSDVPPVPPTNEPVDDDTDDSEGVPEGDVTDEEV